MEKWRRVWRFGIAPQISEAGLRALELALHKDDRRIEQGARTSPPPMEVMHECNVVGACAIGFCGWQGDGLRKVGQVESYFHRICDRADAAFHEAAACRYFLHWFDATPRAEVRRELLAELALVLQARPIAA